MIEYRSVEVESVDAESREISLIVAPYGVPAPLGGGVSEQYARGLFGDLAGRVMPLKLERGPNHAGPVVGRSLEFTDTPEALTATFRVSETRDGDDALTLARDGALFASAGFLVNDAQPLEGGTIELRAADLREVTLTGVPAYRDAEILEVRSTQEVPSVETNNEATEAATNEGDDAAATADVVADAVTRALDEYRRGVADEATPTPEISSRSRGHEHRSIGDLVGDVISHARQADPAATERVTGLIERGVVSTDGRSISLEARAFTAIGTTGAGALGVAPDTYIPDLLELLREGRPVANLFASRPLPARGKNVSLPKVTQGGTVDYQALEGDTVSSQTVLTGSDEFPKSTLAGGQGVSIQAAEWSDPSYMTEVINDHIAAYAEKVDLESIVGDGATPNATAYTGILEGAGDVPAGGTGVLDALGVIGKASAAVYAATKRPATVVLVHSSVWGAWVDLADTDGRPIVTTDAPQNPAGMLDASSIAGTVRGLPVVLDDNVPVNLGVGTNETPIIVTNFRDALLFENQGAPAQIALTYPDVLVTDVSVYGFSALAIRRPLAFQAISGVIAPA